MVDNPAYDLHIAANRQRIVDLWTRIGAHVLSCDCADCKTARSDACLTILEAMDTIAELEAALAVSERELNSAYRWISSHYGTAAVLAAKAAEEESGG